MTMISYRNLIAIAGLLFGGVAHHFVQSLSVSRQFSFRQLQTHHQLVSRFESSKFVHSFLSNYPELDAMKEEELAFYCKQMLQTYDVLKNQGVVICPTTVGYTLITTQNTDKMKSLKGRPDGKPCGIMGTPEIYRAAFGTDPPLKSSPSMKHTVSYMGMPLGLTNRDFLQFPRAAIGPKGQVGIWLELGPVIDYLASRFWLESGDLIIGTSCNVAGEGNPQSNRFHLSHVDSRVRSKVDFEVSIPHWGIPDLDADGRWLSAPIWDLEKEVFLREGRDQGRISSLLLQEEEEPPSEDMELQHIIPEIQIPA